MSRVQNNKIKVYSADQKIWIGMRSKDVRNDDELRIIFNYANKNGDKVIDEDEMKRYNGPCLVVDKDDRTKQRFTGYYAETLGKEYDESRVVAPNEFEFYPGMKYGQIQNKDFELAFDDLDSFPDGVLTKDEIKDYQHYIERKKQYNQILDENRNINKKNDGNITLGGTVGFLGGVFGAFSLSKFIMKKLGKKIYRNLQYRGTGWCSDQVDWKKVPKLLKNLAKGGGLHLLIGAGVIALGVGVGVLAGKVFNKEELSTEEFNDVKKLEKQYKHIYADEKVNE